MKTIVVALVIMLSGCSMSGAIYSDTNRQLLPYNFKGGETFCWEGVGWGGIGVGAVGWGTHECSRGNAIMSRD